MLIPFVQEEEGQYSCRWEGAGLPGILSDEELEDAEQRVRNSGFYPIRFSQDEIKEFDRSPQKADAVFIEVILDRLRQWLALAEERLAELDVRMIFTPGNDDAFVIDEVINEARSIEAGDGRIVRLGAHEMLSLSWSNLTPWDTPRECSEEEMRAKIDSLASQIEDMENAVFNIHVPPHGVGLDVAPEVSPDGLSVRRGGTILTSVGSTAVKDAIMEYQPLLSLHGHIHESRGAQRLGRTLSLNAGSTYGEWTLQGAVVDLEPGKVKSYNLTTG